MSPIVQVVKAAESSAALVLSRLSMITMPFATGAVLWLGQHYLDERFDKVQAVATTAAMHADAVAAAAVSAADNTAHLNSRVDVIEANMASSSNDRTDFQRQITHQVEKLTDVVTSTSNQVSAISATLGALHSDSLASLPNH